MEALRRAWLSIDAGDYEQHMATIGQAEANARLTQRWLAGLPAGGSLMFAGAGPGQMLGWLDPAMLADHSLTFTDIQPAFLDLLRQRAPLAARIILDDIECTQLEGPFDNVVIVLVLEHVDWRKALLSLRHWSAQRVLIVIQQNPASVSSAITPGRELPATMAALRDDARPHLIAPADLEAALGALGYRLAQSDSEPVADEKLMLACHFERNA